MMDVNLTISLMRGQMGTVIEKAVNVAVETVLGEMIRVVGMKFDEFRREMTAKEKENDGIKQMLEISRSQMKTMRKYLSAVTAKDDRRVFSNQRHALSQLDVSVRARMQAGDSTLSQGLQRGMGSNGTVISSGKVRNILTKPRNTHPPADPVTSTPSWGRQYKHVSKTHDLTQEPVTTEDQSCTDIYHIELDGSVGHLASMKEENAIQPEVERGSQTLAEVFEPVWAEQQETTTEREHTETLNSESLSPPTADVSRVTDRAASGLCGAPLKVKEEESEVEIICVKEEPQEVEDTLLKDCLRAETCQQGMGTGQGNALDRTAPHQTPSSSAEHTETSFTPLRSSTHAAPQAAGAPRQARPWLKDLNLYEEYKHRKAELRRRSQTRRRELEQTLPQALLADLVKERREKTRLRVARWRAKRKLQACLMTSQVAPFGGPPTQGLHVPRSGLAPGLRRAGASQQYGGFGYGRSHSAGGAHNVPLQHSANHLLSAHRRSMADSGMQPGGAAFSQQRILGTGSEAYQ